MEKKEFDNDGIRDTGASDERGDANQVPHPEGENSQNLSPEEEWAAALKINFTPPPVPGKTPPPIPQKTPDNFTDINPSVPPQIPDNDDDRKEFERNETTIIHEPSQSESMPPTFLIWSILSTVFCCFIPGIVAIIFSSQVSTKYYSGDTEGAQRASKIAEIWIIISFVLGVLSATLYLPFMLISV